MTKSKTIVTVVCTMLTCVLMATFCVSLFGCALDKNLEYFDMKNFVGEYENATIASPEDEVVTINICTRTLDSRNIIMTVGGKIVNGNLVLTDYAAKNNTEDNIVKTDTLDANVVAMILYFTKVFDGNCVVTETEFKFLATGTTMKIIENEYIRKRYHPIDLVPVRFTSIHDDVQNVTFKCELRNTYYDTESKKLVELQPYFKFVDGVCFFVQGSGETNYELCFDLVGFSKIK